MVFSSLNFLFCYLPIVLTVHKFTPLKWRNFVLLLFNLIFYGWGEPIYIWIMVFSTVVDYTHGILIERFRSRRLLSKMIVASSVIINLGLLFFFKYYDFVAELLGFSPLGIALPIGISFYTFQTMSYTIDIYRQDAPVQHNIINFGTYVTLFPQLIAGPIVKYKEVAKELSHRRITVEKFSAGVVLFTVGLSKKVLLANYIGMLWDVYKVDTKLTALGAWLGILSFAFQIYFDFSGYSDMARGLGKMLGFEFLENFNYPYISKSATEFWRRWHISLGSWFREYLYIPLGGNRKGKLRTIFNLAVVWLATGLWHGAALNFVLWGIYYAVILIVEKTFLSEKLEKFPLFLQYVYSFLVIIIGWTIFAVEDFTEIAAYLKALIGWGGGALPSDIYYFLSYLPMLLLLSLGATPIVKRLFYRLSNRAQMVLCPIFCFTGLFLCTAYLVDSTYNPFLYFRF